MRTYQTLTLIGVIFGIIIAFFVFATLSVVDIGLTSVEDNFDTSTSTYQPEERKSDLSQIGWMAGISILMMIVGLVLVFALPARPKIVGIYLIILSGVVLLGMGFFGVLPFALFLPAGIVALRYKPQKRYTTSQNKIEDKDYSDGEGGSPIK